MAYLMRNGHAIHYEIHGDGRPVILLHGICVSFAGNFVGFGWIDSLCKQGLQVIGLDFLGHGQSDKPHDPAAYGTYKLAADVVALLDHLLLETASLVGYSMGSVVALHLLHTCPQRFGRSVLIATGDGLLGLPPHTMAETAPQLARALDSDHYPTELPKHVAMYWNFATKVGGDRLASAAAARAHYPVCTPEEAGRIAAEVLVISGEIDPVLGQGPVLARSLAHGRYLEIAGADHFMLAASDEAKEAVAQFLAKGH
jgi:pimeloyl-ACP methyl ester carboxylesterase